MKRSHNPPSYLQQTAGFGALYGAMTGIFYALCLWAYDAILLASAHAYFPFIKLLTGALVFAAIFAIPGFITAAVGKAWVGLLTWVPAAFAAAYMMVYIPFRITPWLMGVLRPELQGWLDYPMVDSLNARFLTAFAILSIFVAFLGLVENLLVEQATHAEAAMAKIVPFAVSLLAMLVAGWIMDELVNQGLRGAVVSVNRTIEYRLDHQGEEIPPATARALHLKALDMVADRVDRPRRLLVESYDDTFGQVSVLVDFDGEWARCMVFYDQLSNCRPIDRP